MIFEIAALKIVQPSINHSPIYCVAGEIPTLEDAEPSGCCRCCWSSTLESTGQRQRDEGVQYRKHSLSGGGSVPGSNTKHPRYQSARA